MDIGGSDMRRNRGGEFLGRGDENRPDILHGRRGSWARFGCCHCITRKGSKSIGRRSGIELVSNRRRLSFALSAHCSYQNWIGERGQILALRTICKIRRSASTTVQLTTGRVECFGLSYTPKLVIHIRSPHGGVKCTKRSTEQCLSDPSRCSTDP